MAGGAMTDERYRLLTEQLGFPFEYKVTKKEQQWMSMYLTLIEYHQIHGTFAVRAKDNLPLQEWVARQRRQYRVAQGERAENINQGEYPIPKKRKQLLDEIGFPWVAEMGTKGARNWTQEAKEKFLDVMRKHERLRPPKRGVAGIGSRAMPASDRWKEVRRLAPILANVSDDRLYNLWRNEVKAKIEEEERGKNKSIWRTFR